jgi:hypothetical protein
MSCCSGDRCTRRASAEHCRQRFWWSRLTSGAVKDVVDLLSYTAMRRAEGGVRVGVCGST